MSTEPKSEYLLLFRGSQWDKGLSPEQLQQVMGRIMAWFDKLHQQGVVKGGQPLNDEGRTVSMKSGRLVVDGPFAETKEAIGGYLLLQVQNLDEAVEIARGCPCLPYGASVEVRPVAEVCPTFQRVKEQLALAVA